MHSLLLAVAILTQDPMAEDVDKAIANLYSDRHIESYLASRELVDIGRKAVPKLIEELGKQREADKAKQVRGRRLICEILGDIRDNSQPALDALVGRLTDTEEHGLSVAAAAAGALARIADDRVAGKLVAALTSKQAETDAWLKYYCIYGLGVMRASSAGEAVRKAMEQGGAAQTAGDNRYLIAAAAADALGRMRDKDSVEALGKLLSNNEKDPTSQQAVAVHAARALERILGSSKGPLEGEEAAVTASLNAWRKWWDAEQTKRNIATTTRRIEEVAAAIEAYKRDQGEYPAALVYLKDKPATVKGAWPEGGYYKGEGFEKGEIKDAWGRGLKYAVPGTGGAPFDVVSYGKDGQPWGKGDDADLWNHTLWKAAKIEETNKAIQETVAALKKFRDDQEAYPPTLNELVTKTAFQLKKPWTEPYLKALPKDGFGRFLLYKNPGTGGEPFDLYSLGADGKEGGTDENADIWNHDKWKAVRAEETKKKLEAVGKAIELFKKEQDRYPEQLIDLKEKPATLKKPWPVEGYCKDIANRDPVNDAFGNPFVYRTPGTGGAPFDLISLGADGKEGGTGPDEDLWYKQAK